MTKTVHGKPSAPILGALLLAALSYALSQTLVAPALPSITKEFGTDSSTSAWVLTGYLLSASIFTPLAGKLGDLFGKARVMTLLLIGFAIGSVVCALATSIEVVILGRLIMGTAGGVFPLAFGIINDEFPTEKRAVGIGLLSAMFGIGGGIGLPLSGVIVDNVDISWLFWIGILALPAAYGVWKFVPPSPARERTRIDWAGAAVLSIGLAALLLGISKANTWGWDSGRVIGLLLGGVAVLVAFAMLELRQKQPLVDMRVLAERPVLATNITGFLTGAAMFGSFLLAPQFAQTGEDVAGYGFSMSVTEAGLLMVPSSIAMLIAGPLAGTFGNRFGFRAVLAAGTAFSAVSFLILALAHDEPWQFAFANVLIGIGIAFAFASMANLIVALVDPREVGIATGINTIARTVGGAFGSALVTALLTAETIEGTIIPTESAYTEAFVVSTVVSLLALASALWIPRPKRGAEAEAAPLPRVDEPRSERALA
ncbi:MAG TPA: MFS transporter [Solirubrobacteraceae bacterium]|nr:MFS transporter [Solirubrobacteraceae bacterium]